MFSSGPSYSKLKTNLRLSINRLKLLEKKKTELAQKARKEIADYIAAGKVERAKIRVEHIIREDYLVEAMEVTEMYCDLVLARFGLIQQMKDLDPGMSEAISSLVWCAPRLIDIPELKVVADQFALKYGKPYAIACREQSVSTISEKLIHKLSANAPPKLLVEKYLQEIASNYNLEYTPDPQVMREADWGAIDPLISLDEPGSNSNNLNMGGGASGGGGGGTTMNIPQQPFSYPNKAAEAAASGGDFVLNLPNVPGTVDPSPSSAGPPMGGVPFSYPMPGGAMGGGPPPAPAVGHPGYPTYPAMHQPFAGGPVGPVSGHGGPVVGASAAGSASWDEMLGIDNSPPPPYTSLDDNTKVPGGPVGPPSAPPPSLPPSIPSPHKTNFPPDLNSSGTNDAPQPAPRSKFPDDSDLGFNLPDLPNVPASGSSGGGAHKINNDNSNNSPNTDDIDFDDLNKRFQELKKK